MIAFAPAGAPPPERMVDRGKPPKITPGRAALVGLLDRYLVLGDSASPLVVQKLMYFMQDACEPLGLQFVKGKYGPYADAIRHVVREMEGHFVSGYGDGTSSRDIYLLPDAAPAAAPFLASHPQTADRRERVGDLIEGFETPYGLELLATTHWVVTREGACTAEKTVDAVRAWSPHKERLFTPDHVTAAWNRLDAEGWLAEDKVGAPA